MVKKMYAVAVVALFMGSGACGVILSIDDLDDFASKKSPSVLEANQTIEYRVAPWVMVQFHKKYLQKDSQTEFNLSDGKLKEQFEILQSRDPKQYSLMGDKMRLVLQELQKGSSEGKKSKKKKRSADETKSTSESKSEESKTNEATTKEGKQELEKMQKELLSGLALDLKESVNNSLQQEINGLQSDLQKNGITLCGKTVLKGNTVKWGLLINSGIIIAMGAVIAGVSGACKAYTE